MNQTFYRTWWGSPSRTRLIKAYIVDLVDLWMGAGQCANYRISSRIVNLVSTTATMWFIVYGRGGSALNALIRPVDDNHFPEPRHKEPRPPAITRHTVLKNLVDVYILLFVGSSVSWPTWGSDRPWRPCRSCGEENVPRTDGLGKRCVSSLLLVPALLGQLLNSQVQSQLQPPKLLRM
jgi:hypothetical protein